MVKLRECEDEAKTKIPAAHMGNIRIMDFNSSTRWTVAILHKFGVFESVASLPVTIAALSNHLQSVQEKLFHHSVYMYYNNG